MAGSTTVDLDHDPAFHAQIADDPRRFCVPLAVITDLSITDRSASVTWCPIPYCCRTSERYRTLGWNFVLTVDDGNRVVVTRRHPSLSSGGLWHLSANEGAEPKDFASPAHPGDRLGVGQITARALREELGLDADPAHLDELVSLRGLFAVSGGLGALLHVPGEKLGWTGDQVLRSHAEAPDGWEGEPVIVDRSRGAFEALAPSSGWTAWGLPCLWALSPASA